MVISELLCFVQNSADVMDEESIIRLCESTFSEEEIEREKKLLFEAVVTSLPMKKRKRAGKTLRNLEDILVVIKETDPEKMPIYVARNLQKLPPVTFDHIDVSKLLKDIINLQYEVAKIKDTYATKDMLNLQGRMDTVNYKRGACLLDSFEYDSGPIGLPHIDSEKAPSISFCGNVNIDMAKENTSTSITKNTDNVKVVESSIPVRSGEVNAPTGTSESNSVERVTSPRAQTTGLTQKKILSGVVRLDNAILIASCENLAAGTSVSNSVERTTSTRERATDTSQIKLMSEVVRDGGSQGEKSHTESDGKWTLVQKRQLRNRFVGMKGKADITSDCKFKAAEVKIPFYIYNIHKESCVTDIKNYIKSKTSVDVVLQHIEMKLAKDYVAYKFFIPKNKLPVFMDENLWPSGVSFRKYVNFYKQRETQQAPPNVGSDLNTKKL